MLPLGRCQRLLRVLQGGRQLAGLCLQAQGVHVGPGGHKSSTCSEWCKGGRWLATPACWQTVQRGSGVPGLLSAGAELILNQRLLPVGTVDHSGQGIMVMQGSRQLLGLRLQAERHRVLPD